MATTGELGMSLKEYRRNPFHNPTRAEGQVLRFVEIVTQTEGWNESVAKREFAIANNSNLSDVGKRDARSKLALEALQELRFLGDKLSQTIEAIDRLKRQSLDYGTRPKGADPLLSYLREREVRDYLCDATFQEREIAFLRAAERLDAETMRAMLDAPGQPWITADMRARGDEAYGERKNPEAWLMIQDLDVLREHVQGIANHAGHVLLTLGAGSAAIKDAIAAQLGGPHA